MIYLTGTRLVVTLLHYMKRTNKRYGVVSLCIGTGMGAAAVFENTHYTPSSTSTSSGGIPYRDREDYFSKSKL